MFADIRGHGDIGAESRAQGFGSGDIGSRARSGIGGVGGSIED